MNYSLENIDIYSATFNTELIIALKNVQLPTLKPDHILCLTDDTGIIQHATGNIPNRKEGYCLDDNSRALILSIIGYKQSQSDDFKKLITFYLSFIHYMQKEDGKFINFLSYSRNYLEETGSEDAFGRTLMALGYTLTECSSWLAIKTANAIFQKAFRHVYTLISPRGIANSIIGLCKYLKYDYCHTDKKQAISILADKLIDEYIKNTSSGWHWYEPILTYDNAIIPLSLLYAYDATQNDIYLTIALSSIEFLESVVFKNGILHTVGNHGWYPKKGMPALFDQQPIDTMAMVLLYEKAYEITRNKRFLLNMIKSYQWFMGENNPGIPLYDSYTGGCSDGLQTSGISYNQGAESTIAYWISYFTVVKTLDKSVGESNYR
jgi:hypothetical protein